MSGETESTVFSAEEVDYLSSLHFINQIDSHLRIVTNVRILPGQEPPRVVLLLELIYDNERVDTLSFDLHNYGYEDIIHVARNVSDNEYLMYEVDTFLAGFSE
jgi:hypothetical protein